MTSFASVKTVLGKVFRPIRRFAGSCYRGLCSLWLLPVRLYRKFLSPLKGQGSCRYVPTCSAYAVEAVTEWGILCGTLLALWRVIRCNPFSKGGHDPVPKRKEVFAKIRERLRRTKSQTPTEP